MSKDSRLLSPMDLALLAPDPPGRPVSSSSAANSTHGGAATSVPRSSPPSGLLGIKPAAGTP